MKILGYSVRVMGRLKTRECRSQEGLPGRGITWLKIETEKLLAKRDIGRGRFWNAA